MKHLDLAFVGACLFYMGLSGLILGALGQWPLVAPIWLGAVFGLGLSRWAILELDHERRLRALYRENRKEMQLIYDEHTAKLREIQEQREASFEEFAALFRPRQVERPRLRD